MEYPTIEDFVGNTPLVRLQRLPGDTDNTLLVKLEGNNPAGSVKDRPAVSMIRRAEERGDIEPGDTLIELGDHLSDVDQIACWNFEADESGERLGFGYQVKPGISNQRLGMRVLEEEGMTADQMILFGFSQGTMMSLHVAPRRDEPFAAVVGFSGRLLQPESLEDELKTRPPVLLVHGDQDDLVPVQSLQDAGQALSELGFEVYAHIMEGTGHGIAPDGLGVALTFIREVLEPTE